MALNTALRPPTGARNKPVLLSPRAARSSLAPLRCRCSVTLGTVNTALLTHTRSAFVSEPSSGQVVSAASHAPAVGTVHPNEERVADIDGEHAIELGDAHHSFNLDQGVFSLLWQAPQTVSRVTAPADAVPIVILPGFGNNSQDYEAPFGKEEGSLVANLKARGWRDVYVVPLERKDWFRVARGLLTLKFWSGGLTTEPGYGWYVEKVAATVERALKETGASQVDLVCHSAGGWLGRAYIGDPKYMPASQEQSTSSSTPFIAINSTISLDIDEQISSAGGATVSSASSVDQASTSASGNASGLQPNPRVRHIVTLGTPQRPPPADKMRDMTGGAQGWVDRTYPGAYFKDHGVQYTCVVGRTVKGFRELDAKGKPKKQEGPRGVQQYAYDSYMQHFSYMQVCGEGQHVEGDAVVPLRSALLPGAQRRIVLRGVYHSMSRIGTFDEESGVVWYGSDSVIDSWLSALAAPTNAAAPATA